MSTVVEIERAIENLPDAEFSKLRTWFESLNANRWDLQIERDAESGKLDSLMDEALAEFESVKTTEL